MSQLNLGIVIASTRPGRVGPSVGQWVKDRAEAHGGFDVRTLDLAEINLPFFDEPNHPRLRQYVHQHTKNWSALVDACDAFVFVMPEYNHSIPATLKNALDFLSQEWQYKPVGLVSYGGVSGGLRAAHVIKPIISALKMVPIVDGVVIPFVHSHLNEQRQFVATEPMEASAKLMINELQRVSTAFLSLRAPVEV